MSKLTLNSLFLSITLLIFNLSLHAEIKSETIKKIFLSQITKNEEYIFGLFNSLDMRYHMDNVKKEEPTLDEMVNIALDIMEQNENGYFLFVEGFKKQFSCLVLCKCFYLDDF